LKALVLDSVSSPIARREPGDEFVEPKVVPKAANCCCK